MLLYQSTKKMFSCKYHIAFQSINLAKIYCYKIQLIWCVVIDKWCSGSGRSYRLLLLCVVVIFALHIVNFCWLFFPFLCKIRRWSVTRPISNTAFFTVIYHRYASIAYLHPGFRKELLASKTKFHLIHIVGFNFLLSSYSCNLSCNTNNY